MEVKTKQIYSQKNVQSNKGNPILSELQEENRLLNDFTFTK